MAGPDSRHRSSESSPSGRVAFNSTLKIEFVHRHRLPTLATARAGIGEWIDGFYNRQRRHSLAGMKSPVDYEHHMATLRAATTALTHDKAA